MLRHKSITAEIGHLRERARALETGAHPTPVDSGGFGRNTSWAKCTIVSPHSMTAGCHLERRVVSDVVYFRVVEDEPETGVHGLQLAVADIGDTRILGLGRSCWP
jgi:hypothetical protein